jgi:hypothetical protein
MNRLTGLVGSLLTGAGLMFLLDPERGARRRALVRDHAASARRQTGRSLRASLEDARSRAAGTLAEARQRWRGEPVADAVLVERVRARLGLVCDVATVDVTVADGCVTLRGVVARPEIAPIVHAAKWTRGVDMVDDQLDVSDVPSGGDTTVPR